MASCWRCSPRRSTTPTRWPSRSTTRSAQPRRRRRAVEERQNQRHPAARSFLLDGRPAHRWPGRHDDCEWRRQGRQRREVGATGVGGHTTRRADHCHRDLPNNRRSFGGGGQHHADRHADTRLADRHEPGGCRRRGAGRERRRAAPASDRVDRAAVAHGSRRHHRRRGQPTRRHPVCRV